MNQQQFGEVLTLKQACEFLCISRTHLFALLKNKELKFYDVGCKNGKKHIYRFMKTDLLKYLRKNQFEDVYEYKSTDGDEKS